MKSKHRSRRSLRVPVDPELIDGLHEAVNAKLAEWGGKPISLRTDLVEFLLLRQAIQLRLPVNLQLCKRYGIEFYDDESTAGKRGLFPPLPGEGE